VLAKGCPKRGRGVGLLPRLPDGLAHARKTDVVTLGPRPLARRHGRPRRLGRGLAPDPRGNIGAAGALQLGCDGCRFAAEVQAVAEIVLKCSRGSFKPDIGSAVVQREAVRSDVTGDDMVMGVHVAAAPSFL
jgi:hypothetical protein